MDDQYLEKIKENFCQEISSLKKKDEIEALKIKFLGKKSEIALLLSNMASLPSEKKKTFGPLVHKLRALIDSSLGEKLEELRISAEKEKLQKEYLDVTLPVTPKTLPGLHPISKMVRRLHEIFHSVGFQTVFGPEIETLYYNFDALNIPPNHPARDLADTFFLPDQNFILRTQTSGVQIRSMEKNPPPLAVISPGRCFRKDEIDATHLPLFHQLEGLVIDKNISFADLKGTLDFFAKSLFGEETQVRFRPDFFPFVEPGAEVALSCPVCRQKSSSCSVCKGTGYIEVAGCGLVHPKVLENGGIDPTKYSGYAFGFGIERLTMIYYGIPDIRLLYENHPDFLEKFSRPLF